MIIAIMSIKLIKIIENKTLNIYNFANQFKYG